MEYRFLGNTGLKVSVLGYGNWVNSNDEKAQERTTQMVRKCYELGVNFFDTAEAYGFGEAERQFGVALRSLNAPREELVISTKIFFGGLGVNQRGTSYKHVIEGVNRSLKNLGYDYVDVIFAHRHDQDTSMEETCRAFNQVIEKGKAFYWGTSEWTSEQIMEAYKVCDKLNLIPPIAEQCQYNMMVRDKFEVQFGNLFDNYRMGSTVWSPLFGGILSGKYNDGVPEGSRLAMDDPNLKRLYQRMFFDPKIHQERIKALKGLGELAKKLGCSQAQLALAWVIKSKDVSTAIFGATRIEQIEDNIKALEVQKLLTPEILQEVEAILGNRPETEFNWKAYTQFVQRR